MGKMQHPFEPDQMFLMPPSLIKWLPMHHLVFFIRDVLEKINLSPITSVYEQESRGYPPYHPKSAQEPPADTALRNFTNPDSRIMPYQKTFMQAYQAQVISDSEHSQAAEKGCMKTDF